MNHDVFVRLREAARDAAVSERDSVVVPATLDATVAVVRVCAETATPLAVRSAAAGSTVAAPPGGVLVSLDRISGVELHAPALTLRAGAGAGTAAVRQRAAAAGLALVGVGEGPLTASVGALVARGLVSRRSLTGVEAVLATGETIAFGGVLKDVVGYDIPSLLLGTMGRLAVLLTATFRLEPAGARTVSPPAPGVVTPDPSLTRAFDPQELLRSSA